MKKPLAAIAALLAGMALGAVASPASAGAQPHAQASVIGGQAAPITRFPWLSFLEFEDAEGTWACTGTVVAPRVVLTAGHCVENPELEALNPAPTYEVLTETANQYNRRPEHTASVSRVLIHPAFRPFSLLADAGLLILSQPVAAPALPLAGPDDAVLRAPEARITIAGWGWTERDQGIASASLHFGTLRVQTGAECDKELGGTPFYAAALQFCAVDRPRFGDSGCFGDSGGPAIGHRADGKPVELGITSLVDSGCDPHRSTVFARADRFAPWVERWIAAVESGGREPVEKTLEPELPTLAVERAREITVGVLEDGFGSRFEGDEESVEECIRVRPEAVRCKVAWSDGGNDYSGQVATRLVVEGSTLFWRNRYTVNWVSDRCRSRNPHPQTCTVRTKRG